MLYNKKVNEIRNKKRGNFIMNIQGGSNNQQTGGGISLSRGSGSPAATPMASTGGGVSLQKGQNVSLTKTNPSLSLLTVGLGWDTNGFVGQDFDLDAQAFMLTESGMVKDTAHFVFYGQKSCPNGSVVHSGDNQTGEGSGDDEKIDVQLTEVPNDVQKILFTVTIHEPTARGQSFGQVSNAYIRILDKNNQQELIRYDLTEDYSVETALVVAELYRNNGEWKFKAVGAGFNDELVDFCNRYGVQLA